MDEQVNLDECRSLDEVTGVAQRETVAVLDPDEAAIERLAESLGRTATGRKASQERLMQLAEDLYVAFCHRLLSGQATQQEIERMGELLGEKPESLQERLTN